MRKRVINKTKNISKKIHIAWPVLCQIKITTAVDELNLVLDRISYRGKQDDLVITVKSAISRANDAINKFNEIYGK